MKEGTNASEDLNAQEFQDLRWIVAKRFHVGIYQISIGNENETPCMFHGFLMRDFAIAGVWRHDLCKFCFARDTKDTGFVRGGGNITGRVGKKNWAVG